MSKEMKLYCEITNLVLGVVTGLITLYVLIMIFAIM